METLTFSEFLDALGKRKLYENCSLYGKSSHEVYDELRELFEVYMKIGGYPEVVLHYLKTKDTEVCQTIIENVIEIFTAESREMLLNKFDNAILKKHDSCHVFQNDCQTNFVPIPMKYFNTALEINIFDKLFSSVALTLLKEKKGTDDLVTDLSTIVFKEESGKVTKKMTNAAISWLSLSHQIAYCSKSIDCNYLNIVDNALYYFADLGVANLFLSRMGEKTEVIEGILCENFVYQELVRRIRKREIAGAIPYFAVEQSSGGELDFYVRSRWFPKSVVILSKNDISFLCNIRRIYKKCIKILDLQESHMV